LHAQKSEEGLEGEGERIIHVNLEDMRYLCAELERKALGHHE